jgi:diacylglycerol kinase (ATP)
MSNPERALPILLNPSAGSGLASRQRERLEAELRRQGIAYALTITTSEDHLRQSTRALAAGNGALAGAGGDSTFLIMLDEIMAMGAKTRLGLIGLGSSNDVPREFAIETLEKACAALGAGRIRAVDVGFVQAESGSKRHFLGQANIGLGAAVNRYVAGLAERGRRLARQQTLAGFIGIIEAYRTGKIPASLSIESTSGLVRGSYIAAVFANTRFWATGRIIAPSARPDDGILDACLIGACGIRRLARINSAAKRGGHIRLREITMLRSAEFRVAAETPFPVQTDGEILKEDGRTALFRAVSIGVLPAALEIFAPE